MEQGLVQLQKACQNDFFNFCKAIHREDGYEFAKFHEYICNEVQKQLDSKKEARLCLSVPPGYGKSSIISKLLPAYLLGRDPTFKIILITYGAKLSDSLGKDCRAIMNKNIYKAIFPDTIIEGEGKTGSFSTTQGGGLRSVGRGGSIIGFRANFILCDDIIKDTTEAMSEKILNGIHEWFPTVPMTRLLPGAGVIILSTRWSKKDLIGLVTSTGKGWTYYNFECICDDPDNDPIGRKLGENLWDFYSLSSRQEIRRTNPKMFETVYQGKPVSDSNRCIFLEDITFTDQMSFPEGDYTVLAYDTASKTSDYHDYSAVTVWKVNKKLDRAILVKLFRKKWTFPQLLAAYQELDDTYKPDLTIIEDASSGTQLLQLKRDPWVFSSKIFLRGEQKIQMAEVLNYKFCEDVLTIHSSIKNNTEAVTELIEFPYGSHDDFPLSVLHFTKWFLSDEKELFARTGEEKNYDMSDKLRRFCNRTRSKARSFKYSQRGKSIL